MQQVQTPRGNALQAPMGREKLFTPGTLIVLDEKGREYATLKKKYGEEFYTVHAVKNNKTSSGEVLQMVSFYAGQRPVTEPGIHFRRY